MFREELSLLTMDKKDLELLIILWTILAFTVACLFLVGCAANRRSKAKARDLCTIDATCASDEYCYNWAPTITDQGYCRKIP